MPRILRSAAKKSEELELRRKSLKVKRLQLRKKSYELQKTIEENKESLDKDIKKACSVFDVDSTDSEESNKESDESVFVSEERDLDWDDHVDVKSPLKDNMRLIYSFSGASKSRVPTAISSEEERVQNKSWIILSSSDLLGKLILFSI